MTNRTRTGIVLFVLTQIVSGCERAGSPIIRPLTGPSPAPPVPVPAGVQLAGTVSDAAWRPLPGARVEVVNGPQAGLSVTADGRGEFRLSGTFDDTTQFRASRAGHVAATWPLPPSCGGCRPNFWIHFELESLAPPANLAGDYTLTFIADSACTGLPEEARTRTYGAKVALSTDPRQPANSRFNVAISGATFLEGYNSFMIGVAGGFLAADVGDWGHGSPGLVEQVAANTYLTLGGGIATSVTDGSSITSSFHGAVDRCELTSEWGARYNCETGEAVARARCLSQNHQVRLTRR